MLQRLVKERAQKPAQIQKTPVEARPRTKLFVTLLMVSGVILISVGAIWQNFIGKPPSVSTGTSKSTSSLPAPQLSPGPGVPTAINMGMPGAPTSITSLQAPLTAAHMKHFTLVAQNSVISVGSGIQVPAWTFNGSAPGPTLHVRQGDLVVVNVVNHLSFGITIHWHGIEVPNSADGVAGVTQDAIKPGQSYTYRFFANEPGTYWYHSHQFSYAETVGGLFGTIVVDPTTPTIHADVDESVALHEWNGANDQPIFAINNTVGVLNQAAQPGQWVRLRIVNTSNTASSAPQLVTLIGVPFKVVALDGHDLNGPQWLNATPLPIGAAQRYDLLFQMPLHGSVSLVTASDNDQHHYQRTPAVVIGHGTIPSTLPSVKQEFDLTTYGQPAHDAITP
ncbi:MAG TPA: multicopper oxidase domain-containing protein, partial [Ktedonobacteraceae bacterium]|nr:multicopper oxidase domain-containing protein [Ktedonobacteraceae bacterium]